MKNKLMAAPLAWLLLATSVLTVVFCLWFVWSSRQNLMAQVELERLNARGNALRALLQESVEFSKHNPAIVPLLQSLNVLPRGTNSAPAPAKGASK
jgi:hypothetical protein